MDTKKPKHECNSSCQHDDEDEYFDEIEKEPGSLFNKVDSQGRIRRPKNIKNI